MMSLIFLWCQKERDEALGARYLLWWWWGGGWERWDFSGVKTTSRNTISFSATSVQHQFFQQQFSQTHSNHSNRQRGAFIYLNHIYITFSEDSLSISRDSQTEAAEIGQASLTLCTLFTAAADSRLIFSSRLCRNCKITKATQPLSRATRERYHDSSSLTCFSYSIPKILTRTLTNITVISAPAWPLLIYTWNGQPSIQRNMKDQIPLIASFFSPGLLLGVQAGWSYKWPPRAIAKPM